MIKENRMTILIGSLSPDLTDGLNANFRFKQFDLSMLQKLVILSTAGCFKMGSPDQIEKQECEPNIFVIQDTGEEMQLDYTPKIPIGSQILVGEVNEVLIYYS